MTGQISGQRCCAGCGRPIEVPANNPHKRYCSPRCRVADWHHHHRPTRAPAEDQPPPVGAEAANAVPTRNAVANLVPPDPGPAAAPAQTTAPRCPHCRQPVNILTLLVPPAAAHVTIPLTAPITGPLTDPGR